MTLLLLFLVYALALAAGLAAAVQTAANEMARRRR